MELQISYSIIFTFFCFLLMIHKLSSLKKPRKTLPPGPWKLPLIGNLHQLVGSLPHRSLTNLAIKYGPFMHLQLGQVSHIILSSPEYAKEVMKIHDLIFANRPRILASEVFCYKSTDIAFSPYGNYWRQLRKICTLELFSTKRVQSFRRIREEEVSALVRNISEHEGFVINLTPKIFALTNSIVARAAFGFGLFMGIGSPIHILQIVKQVIKLSSGLSISDFYPSMKFISIITGMRAQTMKVHKDCDRMFGDIIRDHQEKKGDIGEIEEDLVDVLLKINQKDDDFEIPLSMDNIKADLMDVFITGTETSATTIEWAMSELLKHPEIMKEVQVEVRRVFGGQGFVDESKLHKLKYLSAIIKETLRLHPPTAFPRENSESCEINGYEIPPKTKIIVNAWAIGRDPKNWSEPKAFEPKRFLDASIEYNFKGSNFEYIPFGSGRRMCPGVTFAIPLLELLLSSLLFHFDWKRPKGMKPEDLDMDESFGSTVTRKNDLSVIPFSHFI